MNKAMLFLGKLTAKKKQNKHNIDLTENESVLHTVKYLKPHQTVLNIGNDTYTYNNEIAERVKDLYELNLAQFEASNAEHQAPKLTSEVTSGDDTALSKENIEEQKFDIVTAFHVLQSSSDIQAAFHRINTLLKPGGLIISATTCLGERRSFGESIIAITNNSNMNQKPKMFSIAELENWVSAGNFEIIETRTLNQCSNDYFLVARKQ